MIFDWIVKVEYHNKEAENQGRNFRNTKTKCRLHLQITFYQKWIIDNSIKYTFKTCIGVNRLNEYDLGKELVDREIHGQQKSRQTLYAEMNQK